MDRTQPGSARATWTVRTPAFQHPWPECLRSLHPEPQFRRGAGGKGLCCLSEPSPLKNPEGSYAQLMLSPPDSVFFHLPLWTVALVSSLLSPSLALPSSPAPCSCPPVSVSTGPGAGPSAGQGAGDDRLLPLAAAGWGLCVAAVRGHRGRQWEEPRGAPRALGQLRAQVRAVLHGPYRGLRIPPHTPPSLPVLAGRAPLRGGRASQRGQAQKALKKGRRQGDSKRRGPEVG